MLLVRTVWGKYTSCATARLVGGMALDDVVQVECVLAVAMGSTPTEAHWSVPAIGHRRRCPGPPSRCSCGRPAALRREPEVSPGEFVEHLILRAEAIWNFQPLVLPPPRPWWKLWGKDPELPAIVADLCNVA